MSAPAEVRSVLVLLASARPGGNTEALAGTAVDQLPPDVERRCLRLADLPLPPFTDLRHSDGRYPHPVGHARTLFEATLRATDLVIATPLYWYTMSASAKLYLDHWSGWLRLADTGFAESMRRKTLWAVSAIGSGDRSQADPLVESLRLTAAHLDMRWGGALLTASNRPGEGRTDTTALDAARSFLHTPAPAPSR